MGGEVVHGRTSRCAQNVRSIVARAALAATGRIKSRPSVAAPASPLALALAPALALARGKLAIQPCGVSYLDVAGANLAIQPCGVSYRLVRAGKVATH